MASLKEARALISPETSAGFSAFGSISLRISCTSSEELDQLSQAALCWRSSFSRFLRASGSLMSIPSFLAISGRLLAPEMAARRWASWFCLRVAIFAISSASLMAESSNPKRSPPPSGAGRPLETSCTALMMFTAARGLLPSWIAFTPTAWRRESPGAAFAIAAAPASDTISARCAPTSSSLPFFAMAKAGFPGDRPRSPLAEASSSEIPDFLK